MFSTSYRGFNIVLMWVGIAALAFSAYVGDDLIAHGGYIHWALVLVTDIVGAMACFVGMLSVLNLEHRWLTGTRRLPIADLAIMATGVVAIAGGFRLCASFAESAATLDACFMHLATSTGAVLAYVGCARLLCARRESYNDIWQALQRVDTAAAALPTYAVKHEGGIEAFTQNIVEAILQAAHSMGEVKATDGVRP